MKLSWLTPISFVSLRALLKSNFENNLILCKYKETYLQDKDVKYYLCYKNAVYVCMQYTYVCICSMSKFLVARRKVSVLCHYVLQDDGGQVSDIIDL